MELPVRPSSQPSSRRNYEPAPWCYLLWGVPAVLVIGTGAAYGASVLSLALRGVFWVTAVRWPGLACLVNARSCGRAHWGIDGVLFPFLSFAGRLTLLSFFSFD